MRSLLDLIFPRACLSCGARADLLCTTCADEFPWIRDPCPVCGAPLHRHRASECGDAAWDRARAACIYAGPAREVMLRYKLGGERRAAAAMGASMAAAAHDLGSAVLTFVPSSPRTLAQRGWNPAEELARAVARAAGLPCRPLLRKVRETQDQASLSRAARIRNLAGAFIARPCAAPVVLVDDIFTTGATAHECARMLRSVGIAKIDVLTFARAL